jgi:sec-independent protein translocase protein TatA
VEGLSVGHLLVVGIVVLLLFGKGKVTNLMGEFGKGISAFKKGIAEANTAADDARVAVARDVTPKADDARI